MVPVAKLTRCGRLLFVVPEPGASYGCQLEGFARLRPRRDRLVVAVLRGWRELHEKAWVLMSRASGNTVERI